MPAADPRRPATQADVARAVGVSRTLVSFAFRGAPGVSEGTRQAILDAAKRLGYRPNAAAADLARKRASAIGLHLLDLSNEVYADIFAGVREALEPTGHRIILGVARPPGRPGEDGPGAGGPGEWDEADLGPLIEARVGVVIAATLIDPDERVRELARDVPIVSVARRIEGVDSVYSDDRAGSRAATEHLLALGHTRIAHVTGPYHEGRHERRQAYDAVMHDAGLAPRVVAAPGYSLSAGREAARVLLAGPDRPTAIVAHNDPLALGVREEALGLGLSVPEDLSLTGYDNSRTAGLTGIDLTSVDLGAHWLGVAAGTAALERLADPGAPAVDLCTQPRLILRGSTAPPA
ncbi:LacI family DNA-binding transcriptional regulator [Sinomonas halotolerans]|uniref:LacI family DNA-binding transcriptional regulator n=1 Tax=Sinomonas halotolerans TaxID=1644133 RepID=A0ABU9WX21_9MICC